MAKNTRVYWYDYSDINNLLNNQSNNGVDYYVADTASQNLEQALQRVSEVFETFRLNPQCKAAVIPINLGNVSAGIYKGSHWVGLTIRKDLESNKFIAYYNDSLGDSMYKSLPNLSIMLTNHGVLEENIIDLHTKQQYNNYDCGAWTVLNLDSLARTGALPKATEETVIAQRSVAFGYLSNSPELEVVSRDQAASKKVNVIQKPTKRVDLSSLKYDEKKSNAQSADENIGFDKLSLKSPPKYVISSIMYADGDESDESSDDDFNEFDKELLNFDQSNLNSLPYRTSKKITIDKKGEIKSTKVVGFVPKATKRKLVEEESKYAGKKSKSLEALLKKIKSSGLDEESQEQIGDVVSTSLCLNRPWSLSTRKNNLLKKELVSDADNFDIDHLKFGVFWEFKWYNQKGKKVEYQEVHGFYKKLKKFDLKKAEEFRKQTEKQISVPYQELRELAKNHQNTKELIKAARTKNPEADIYLSFVDSDTVSFNGIYSAYARIHKHAEIVPTVMSTGYQFTQEQKGDHPFVEGCNLDRQIRIATAKSFPEGTYYPEPNFCVRVLDNKETVEESFVDKKRGGGVSLESPILLTNIFQQRGETTWVFADDSPVITAIPERVRKTRNKKSDLKFSQEFQDEKGQPTQKDVRQFDQMSQSKTDPREFAASLYYNRGFNLEGNNKVFGGKVKQLLECIASKEDNHFIALKEHVSNNSDFLKIKAAILGVKHVKQYYAEQNIRTPDMQELYNYIQSTKSKIKDYNQEFLEIVANANIVRYFQDRTLDIDSLATISSSLLEGILYNDDIVAKLRDWTLDLSDLQKLYNADILEIASSVSHSGAIPNIINISNAGSSLDEIRDMTDSDIVDFSELINSGVSYDDIKEAMSKGYDVSDVLSRYQEDPMHMMFMSGDPDEILLENSNNSSIVQFGLDHYDIDDIEWIRGELRGDRDWPSAALMEFDLFSGKYAEESKYDNEMECTGDSYSADEGGY